MLSKARSLLARLRSSRPTRQEEARFDGRMEELERRILFSADAAGALGLVPDTELPPPLTCTLPASNTPPACASTAVTQREVAFVDASLPDAKELADLLQKQVDANRTLSIYWIDANSDGVKQISDVLATLKDVDAVHILSHGSNGNLQVGNATLNAQTLSQYAGDLASWHKSLSQDADLMLYGCDLAQNASGQQVVNDIQLLTGANVAASIDLTGDSSRGGDWVLEYQLGQINTGVALDVWHQTDWHGLLATYTVTNTSDSGAGSLRAAITSANGNAGADTINFNISSGSAGTGSDTGAYVITLASGLPTITEAVSIDASTQSGYVAGGLHTVVLDGNDAGAYGLQLSSASDGSTVRGLVIRNFTSYGIYTPAGSDNHTIVGNYIGSFYADGSNAGTGKGNATSGIFSQGANATIGGATAADSNVISGNSGAYGIYLSTGADGTVIKGNYIGTNAAGTSVFSTTNPNYGIMVETSATNITIGGTATGEVNVVSGHTSRGMWITTTGTVTIQGNYVGTDYTGTVDLGNTGYGIYLDDTGSATIGGTTAGAGNLVSGNDGGGIYASNGSVTIQGNTIGLNAAGTAKLANTGVGLYLDTSNASTVGDNTAAARNIISGNSTYGIHVAPSAASSITIKGNYIGVGADGSTLLGNGSAGIYINNDYVTVGGKTAGDGNIIAGNGGAGIAVVTYDKNLFYRNSIYSNTGLGIDLGNDGVTANDYNDGDGGANYQTNYPVITSAVVNGSNTTITGSIDFYNHSTADTVYIELFSSPALDGTGYGEGKTYLGSATLTTDTTTGDATFSITVTGVSVGDYITAVANVETSYLGASEFSLGMAATSIANAPKGKLLWNDNDQTSQWVSNWTGSAFTPGGMTGLTLDDDVTMMAVAEAPTRDELIMIGSADVSGKIEAIVWNGSSWTAPLGIPVTSSTSASASQYNSFAVAYESQSGDAILVWDNGTTGTAGLSYAVWNGTSWSSTSTITAPSSGEPLSMKLASNPTADGMVLIATTNTGDNCYAIVWNGSSWGNSQSLGTSLGASKQYFEINAAYESQSGEAMVVYDSSTTNSSSLQYRTWNGTSWSSEGTIAAPSGITAGSDVYVTAIASDATSNRIAVAVKDAANEVYVSIWDGSSWGNAKAMTTSGIDTTDHHATMAVAFESLSGDLLCAYGKAAGPNVYYQTWSSGGGWSTEQTGPSMGATDITYSLKLYSDPYSNTIMMADQDGGLDLNMVAWDGSAWGTVTTVDSSTGEHYRENYAFAWNRYTPPSLSNITGDTLAYTEDASAAVIDQSTTATASDGDDIGYTDGNLTVSFTAGSTSTEDVLSIRNQGTGAGQIGVSGSDVTYAGTIIGTYTGGSSGAALVITLNSAASNAAVSALANNITYVNTNSTTPSTTSRTVRFVVTNARGLSSANYDNTITVSAVNDAPTATITPTTYSATEQTTLTLNGTGLTIADVDAGSSSVQATLSVVSGTLTVSAGTTGVTVGNSGTSSVTLTGTVTQINNLLAGSLSGTVSYIINSDAPPASDTLTLGIDDQGNTGSGGAKTGSDTATINITAVNDAPVITSNGGGASASVNTAENTTSVTTVTATDPDTGATQTYSISGGADAAKFSINSSTGVLTFASAPNFESPTDSGGDNVYDVIVQVSDGSLTDTQAIAVTVTDMNDNTPVITSDGAGATATKNVAENSTAVTTVTATDADAGSTLTYSIAGGADSAKFSINGSTGVLTFASAPDYESPTDSGGNNVYDVTVQVSDGTNTDTQAIAVTVTDLNDNAPAITSDGAGATASLNVAENSTAVTTVTATDADAGSTLTYSITGGADSAKFSINSSTGVLTFASAPDYESPTDSGANNVYDVTVQVSDGTNTDTQAIAVTVTNVNDNTPVITSDGAGATATKNVAENSTAVTTVTATDADAGSTLTYSITGGADSAKFSINASTGVLTFVSAPDYESPTDAGSNNVYDVTVQVSDGTNTDTQTIAVTVTDVNDNAPIISSDGGGASATKNVAENGTAVTTVTATDVDTGTTLTYSITGGADSAKFSINSSTGVLTFVSAPDYESPTDAGGDNVYDVTVQVSDGTNTDTQTIAVTVTDLNDNAPVITSDGGGASATKNVAENGTAVTTVTATDVDTGTTLTYSITGGADSAKFSINSATGVLTFVSAPNYESPTDADTDNVYDVTVQVSDGTNTDTQTIAVTVTDLNDNAPVITSDGGGTSATKNVAENGTAVTTVTATDVDTGTTLTYSITGGADADKFSINASTGVLTFVSAPDYESPTDAGGDNVYDVTVQVSDGTNTDTQAIAVTVTDVNDNAPVITSDGGGASATKNVAENGTAVTTVTATDVDTGTTLTYSITGGADSAKFSINSSTGVLTFVSAPDYESPTDSGGNNVYDVTVQVSDGTNTDTQAIAITVTDVNDNAPVITSDGGGASATKNVAENGTAVTTVTATDVDTGTTLTYSITGGADSAKFSINSSTGVLTFVSAPDYESPTDAGGDNVYDVTVQVSDGTNTDSQAIAVTVTDVNDNAPVISSDGGGASATKNIAENGTAVTTVTATDVDTGTTLTYSITGGADSAKFSINSSTGVLTFVSAPDYESPTDADTDNVYDVTVQVSDGTNTDTQAIAVTVTDLNDNAPVISSDGGGASATKNVAENGSAVTTVTATDVDTGTTLTYSITGGADSAKFSINSSTGVLTFVSAPDYESPTDADTDNVYDVTVQVSDGTNTDTQTIAVTVTDLNDNAPVITSDGGGASATKNVAENGTAVTTVTATDVDTGTTLTYSITGGADSAKFSINSSTGVLTFVSAPDYESPTDAGGDNVYDVTVQVSDGTNTDSQAIAVTVTDVNDNAPVISSDGGGASATKNIAENGTAVTTVTATDVDTGTTLTYSITGGADSAKFSINSSTGVLTFVSAPDYESPTDAGGDNVYDVTVQVSDGTNTDTQAIAITVTDVNDNAPVISSDGGGASATKNIAENGTAVTTVTATDVDTGTTLTYSITGGADSAKFSINSSTGVLTFVSAPDYEAPTDAGGDNVYDVTVQVSDGTNTDSQAIAVTVTDLNDNAPVITSDGGGASATKNVAENGTTVTTVTATDVDTGATLTYSITGGADSAKFSINSSTGVLTFVSAPDYEVPTDAGGDNVYDVTVQVSDGTNTDTQAIAVTVTDLNDNASVITSDGGGASATKNVAENGTAVTTVTATDVDTGTTLTYSITGGADSAKFSINSSSGVLTFVSAPNFESPTDSGADNVYDVTVQVSDGTNTDTQTIAVTVTDLNDNAPVITSDGGGASATKNVAENGTAVTTVTATDVDTGTTLTYSITGGADSAKFSINSSTGVLTFVSAPDYESPTDAGGDNVYDVTVQVSDGTNTDTQTIALTVTDVNDNAPVISSDGGGASATKNIAENGTAATTVTATDVDTGTTLTYSITGGADSAKFSINSSTGVLTFVSAPDYENPTDSGTDNVYDVTIQVSDGTDTDTQTIAVTVTDVSDNAPVITSDGGGASATKNVAENGTAVTTVTATDADSGTTLTYSITGGADAARFSINASTGVLTFVSAPDYESPTDAGGNNVYDVTVQVSDGANTDTQAIAVTVTDVNDNAPVINSDGGGASATRNVAENGTTVTTVTATDVDTGTTLTYSITGGADSAKFSINSSTGVLTFVSAPNYESPTDSGGNNVYDVTIQVSDGTNSDTQAIAVTVTDVNDNAPVITSDGGGTSATKNVAENGTSVTSVTATDVDTGTTLSYSITGGADAAKFSINSSTGVLTFVSAPDYESPTDTGGNNVYDVTVQVSDGTNADSQAISVTVTDVNDNAPVITSDGGGASATKNVAENGTAVTTVTATDVDTGTTLTYSITGGADSAKFSINASTGVLTFVSAPDYESPTDSGGNNIYDVIVQVSDGTNTDSQAIAVTVTDVNDNAPIISSDGGGASATKNITENGTAVTTVTATDVDTGTTLTYSITGGADAAKFSINSSTGVLTFVSAQDYESPTDTGGNNVYDVTVQVSDGTNTDTQAIAVTVTDVNDNAPVISSDGGGASATRNVAEHSSTVTTVTATDIDTGTTLTYSITGGADSAKFSINSSTGVLTFVSAPDYESPTDSGGNNIYDVIVQVSDGTNTDSQSIAVTVTDVNDNAPVINSDGGGASATRNVAENGTAVTTVTATDVDAGTTLTYSITGGADAVKFSINSATGVLTFVSAPDYENPTDAGGNNVYDVTVQVSDGTNTDTQAIAVTVADVNDNAPTITSDGGGASATKNVAENGTAVTTVTATDVDTGTTLTYSITGGADAAKFSINSATGVLTFVSAPDHESPTDAGGNNVYDVTVQVSDGAHTDTQTMAVTVTDVNDNAPVITSDGGGASATKNVAENGTAVTTVTATDVDTGATLTYSIAGGADAAKFNINSSTGVLTFVSAPDYEAPTDAGGNNVYDVTVQVSDGTNTDTQAIAITVTNVNDSAPVITSDGGGASATKNVAENGTAVTTVTATDVDTGTTLTYSITGGADAAKFSINSATGVLTFVSAPDYENPTDAGGNNVYDVTVQVSDGANTDTQAIAITVTGVNESPTAQITQGNYNATEKVSLTLQGTGIQIADPDALSGTVQVQLSVSQGTLNVSAGNAGVSVAGSGSNTVSITGTLTQINQLLSGSSTGTISYVNNHDLPSPTDTLTLTVNDLGNTGAGTPLSDSATATINVTSVNDSPVMSAITLTANAAPSASWASSSLLNGTSDPDGDPLSIRVVQGPQHGTLTISGSGQVTYTTNTGYVGSDSFSYVAFDGQASSSNVRVMSIQASSPVVDMGPSANTSNTDSPPTKVDTSTKNDSDTSTPKPGKDSNPKPVPEDPIVVAPPSKTDAPDSTEVASIDALLHHLTSGTWSPGRLSDTFGTARQIFFTPSAGTYVTSTVSTIANAPSVMQLLDLIRPNLEHAADINLSLTPLSGVTHALPAGHLADADTAENDNGQAPIRLSKIASYSSGLGLSIGTIWWTARMSGLVTSALISTPAWRSLDPLPVVTSPTDEQDDEHDGDSRLGDREVEHLFDGDKPLEQDMPIIQ